MITMTMMDNDDDNDYDDVTHELPISTDTFSIKVLFYLSVVFKDICCIQRHA